MTQKLVSVVIATYNMATYLPVAIKSALNQTYPNIEVNVVDDGSSDFTQEVMAEFSDDSRVHYQRQDHLGQAPTKVNGVNSCKGDYIAFLDADDIWMPEKLALQLQVFDQSPETGVVYSDLVRVDEQANPIPESRNNTPRYSGNVSDKLFVSNFVGFSTAIVKRECFDKLGSFDETLQVGIDYDLWLRFSTRYKFGYVNKPTVFYRVWPGQISTQRNFEARYETGQLIRKRFLMNNPGLIKPSVRRKGWSSFYVNYGHDMLVKNNNKFDASSKFAKAILYRPDNLTAWKAMIMLAMR